MASLDLRLSVNTEYCNDEDSQYYSYRHKINMYCDDTEYPFCTDTTATILSKEIILYDDEYYISIRNKAIMFRHILLFLFEVIQSHKIDEIGVYKKIKNNIISRYLELLPISLIKIITDFGDLFKNKIPKNWTEDEKITVKVDDSYILMTVVWFGYTHNDLFYINHIIEFLKSKNSIRLKKISKSTGSNANMLNIIYDIPNLIEQYPELKY